MITTNLLDVRIFRKFTVICSCDKQLSKIHWSLLIWWLLSLKSTNQFEHNMKESPLYQYKCSVTSSALFTWSESVWPKRSVCKIKWNLLFTVIVPLHVKTGKPAFYTDWQKKRYNKNQSCFIQAVISRNYVEINQQTLYSGTFKLVQIKAEIWRHRCQV